VRFRTAALAAAAATHYK